MTAASTETPIPGPADSLEVRWITAGPAMPAMRDWFARFPARVELRDDAYLLVPHLPGLSVKLRDGLALEVKSYLGSAGVLDLPHHCRGRLESWRKWSFRCDPLDLSVVPAGWSVVRKRRLRTWFPVPAREDVARPPSAAPAGCAVELTEADVRGESWWSVGLEATGSAGLPGSALRRAAGLVFAQPPPAGAEFSLENSWSYTEWLLQHR